MFRMNLIALLSAALFSPAVADEKPQRDIIDTAVAAKSFKTLAAALKAADLIGALKAEGPFTVFAPTDAAFAKLPEGTVAQLLKPENREKLQAVLAFHVVPGRLDTADLLRNRERKSLGGPTLSVSLRAGRLGIQDASFVTTDIACTNGVIHVIDSVMLPPAKRIDARTAARQILELAIERGVPVYNDGNPAACASIYEIAVRAVAGMAGSAIQKQELAMLEAAIAAIPAGKNDKSRAWDLRRAMDRVLISMDADTNKSDRTTKAQPKAEGFQPLIEAELPKGFPAPGPVGETVLKDYPKYRAARADGRASFWKLFNHIKKNKIAMTAPVEMAVSENGGQLEQQGMAFLYANPDLGRTGADGSVDVVDLDPIRVLSHGIRGPMTDEKLQAAKVAIRERLGSAASGLQRDGEWRLLGYNSPMVPAAKRFWELQLPVQRVDAQGSRS
jgi:uncharacterized surface protein with fasciclin (FAS1) repeats